MKKALSLLLALLMLLSILPGVAAADEGAATKKTCPPHNWAEDPMRSPTCTEAGVTYRFCTDCNEGGEVTVPALGHDWESEVLKEATCTEEGEELRVCRRCKAQERKTIPALGHSWKTKVTKEATCTEDGEEVLTCKRCKKQKTKTVSALGHDWGSWKVTKEATCEEEGREVRTCKRCKKQRTNTIPALGHDWGDWYTIILATCTEKGLDEKACNRCGVTRQMVIPARGHDWGDWYTIILATCTEKGLDEKACNRCGVTRQMVIPAHGHWWGEWYIKEEAKPGQPGIKRRDCLRGDIFEEVPYTEPIPAPDPDDPVPDPDPDPDPDDPVPDPDPEGVTLVLSIVSVPANGWAFNYDTPEKIRFHYRITNLYKEPITIRGITGMNYVGPTSGTIDSGDSFEGTYDVSADIYDLRDVILSDSSRFVSFRNEIYLQYTTADGRELDAFSNVKEWNVTCDPDEEQPALTVTKKVINTPARGYFLPGEQVDFEVTVTNTGDKDILYLNLQDLQLGQTKYYGAVPVCPGDTLYWFGGLSAAVADPAPGVTAWTEENVVIANGETPDGDPVMGMASVTYECRAAKTDFSVRKYETSVPFNGPCYVEGERICYGVEVTNEGDTPLKGAKLDDPLCGDYGYPIPELAPGETWRSYDEMPMVHRVTASDVGTGSVTNEVTVYCGTISRTARVTSLIGEGEPPKQLVLAKKWTGPVPERGYYVEGDVVNFSLMLANYNMDEAYYGIEITDVLDAGYREYCSFLDCGKVHTVNFSYTVTDQDVGHKEVENWAYARYSDIDVIESNHVTVPCGKPNSILDGDTRCERTLTGHGDGIDTYEQAYCGEHGSLKAQADALPAAEAAALWRGAVEELYIRWIEKVALNDDLCLHARTEYTAFLALCDVLAENETEAGAKALAKLLEDKCTDLCYVLNSPADEPRKDVLSDGVAALPATDPGDVCVCEADGQNVTTAALCAAHAPIPAQAEALLQQSAAPSDAMRYGALISEAYGYQNAANRLNGPAARALAAYIEAARTTLGDFYGSGTLQVGELTARAAREVLLAICAGR